MTHFWLTLALELLGDPHAILVIDETSFRKRGKKSAGVAKQHCGTTGQLENCQVGVVLAYVSRFGYTLLDRELYLPMCWIAARKRCQEAEISEEVRFQTKCEQAQQMIERLWKAHIPFAWVVADTVYGGNGDLRNWLEAHQYFYRLAVACDLSASRFDLHRYYHRRFGCIAGWLSWSHPFSQKRFSSSMGELMS